VGKGTQADFITKKYKTCQLSTGNVFRAAKNATGELLTAAMREAVDVMQQGKLVPDETVVEMVRERCDCLTCGFGFILDGFPRTVDQAKALEDMLTELRVQLDAVLDFQLDEEEVIRRLSGRRTCRKCQATFHLLFGPPKEEGICDKCGGELYQREDDLPDSIRMRLKMYHESTAPLSEYYREQGLLIEISAEGTPKDVFERADAAIQERFLND
jgi:adenylate kinase